MPGRVKIGLIGDHDPEVKAHRAIPLALELAAARRGCALELTWIGTETIGDRPTGLLQDYAGLWCVPATPYASPSGALAAIRFARETPRPFLGTCGGFQHAVLEYARNVLGLTDAGHAESSPQAAAQVISPLTCSLVERSGDVLFAEGSIIRGIYDTGSAVEEYHCRYGLNPSYVALLERHGLSVGARDAEGDVRAVELRTHPFFIATLFQPERAALAGRPHPLVEAFVAAAGAA